MRRTPWYQQVDWPNTLFLIGTPVAAAILAPMYIYEHGLSLRLVLFFFGYGMLTNLAVTAGYHRYFAHLSYGVHPLIKFFYLVIGAGAFQGPVLKWASEHRRHHRVVDTEEDPYSIKKGFFFAHIGWLFTKADEKYAFEEDLNKDPWVQWQYKYYVPIAAFMCFGVPTLLGWAVGNAWGGLVIGGLLRVVFTQHCTFFINSLCHMVGTQPYNDRNSAKDNFVLALLTCGEGYHNFHHRFASDYRNGIRWYQWDPTKWWIRSLAFSGLAFRLKRIPAGEIFKARMSQDQSLMLAKGVSTDTLNQLKEKVESAQLRLKALATEYARLKASVQEQSRSRVTQLKAEMKVAKLEFKMSCAQWVAYTKMMRGLAA